jgi:hypothetical protein
VSRSATAVYDYSDDRSLLDSVVYTSTTPLVPSTTIAEVSLDDGDDWEECVVTTTPDLITCTFTGVSCLVLSICWLFISRSDSYDVGDVAAYRSDTIDTVVLHRIVEVKGERFVFQGDNSDFLDPDSPRSKSSWARRSCTSRGAIWLSRLSSPPAIAVFIVVLLSGGAATVDVESFDTLRDLATLGKHRIHFADDDGLRFYFVLEADTAYRYYSRAAAEKLDAARAAIGSPGDLSATAACATRCRAAVRPVLPAWRPGLSPLTRAGGTPSATPAR